MLAACKPMIAAKATCCRKLVRALGKAWLALGTGTASEARHIRLGLLERSYGLLPSTERLPAT